MSVDQWLTKRYDDKRYNCMHLVRDVWLAETGLDLRERLESLFAGRFSGSLLPSHVRAFRELVRPVSPCLVIMRRPKHAMHWGVFLRGNVLHIQRHGVEFLPIKLATRGFTNIRFALPC